MNESTLERFYKEAKKLTDLYGYKTNRYEVSDLEVSIKLEEKEENSDPEIRFFIDYKGIYAYSNLETSCLIIFQAKLAEKIGRFISPNSAPEPVNK